MGPTHHLSHTLVPVHEFHLWIGLEWCVFGHILQIGFNFNTAWISNHILGNVWNEIMYPFPSFNVATVEVWKWIGICHTTHNNGCIYLSMLEWFTLKHVNKGPQVYLQHWIYLVYQSTQWCMWNLAHFGSPLTAWHTLRWPKLIW